MKIGVVRNLPIRNLMPIFSTISQYLVCYEVLYKDSLYM